MLTVYQLGTHTFTVPREGLLLQMRGKLAAALKAHRERYLGFNRHLEQEALMSLIVKKERQIELELKLI